MISKGRLEAHHISVPSSLPKLAGVGAREEGAVFLALMFEDGVDLPLKLHGAEGDCHLNFVGLELLPSASVQPHLAAPKPALPFHLRDCEQDSLQCASAENRGPYLNLLISLYFPEGICAVLLRQMHRNASADITRFPSILSPANIIRVQA